MSDPVQAVPEQLPDPDRDSTPTAVAGRTTRSLPEPRTPRDRAKPDPRPSRLAFGIGALAAVSVIAAGIGRWPSEGAVGAGTPIVEPLQAEQVASAPGRETPVMQPIRYVRLKPGQKAPPGARVVREKAPAPRVVVRWVSSSPSTTSSRAPVTRTRQSGR